MTIKRIAAISAAAIMTMSITAISASAANRSRKETIEVKGYDATVTLEAIVEEHNQVATTYYDYAGNGSKYPEVRVHMHVDDYYTGLLMKEDDDKKTGSYPKAKAEVHYCESPISLFSAHEVYPDGIDGWGHYMSLCGVDNTHEEEH